MREFWINVWNSTKKICRKVANKDMWCKVGRTCLKYLSIPSWLVVLLVIITVVSLCYIFINNLSKSPLSAVAYAVSAYTLVAFCIKIPAIVKKTRLMANKSKTISYVRNHDFTKRMVNDKLYRGKVNLYKGVITSVMFAVFKAVVGIIYRSVWFGAVSVYYIALSGMRYLLVRYMKKADNIEEEMKNIVENKGYRACGFLMFFLNVAMAGMIVQMVVDDKGYEYPGIIIYVSAMYAFYTLTMSIINIFKYRKLNSPIISAAKIISFSGALMSILALQTAMLAQFGAGQDNFRRLMNSLTGAGVCTIIFALAIVMIIKSGKRIRGNIV